MLQSLLFCIYYKINVPVSEHDPTKILSVKLLMNILYDPK